MSEEPIPVSQRAAQIEYAIRDVVVPATALEAQGHNILKLNIGDPMPTLVYLLQLTWLRLFRMPWDKEKMDTLHPMDSKN